MRVGIIGQGTLGNAIANGLRDHAAVRTIAGTTRSSAHQNAALVAESSVVLLCVKPMDAPDVLRSIAPVLTDEHVLISTAAALTTAMIRDHAERGRLVRAMPNTPARVGAAMTVLARAEHTCPSALETADVLFMHLGRTLVMDETKMDAVTAVSGCGPAFAFVVMEAMIDAAIALGIDYDSAREMVAQTLLGSAKLLLTGTDHPAQLKTAVATPAGKTVKGLIELERSGFRASLINAVIASAS